MKIFNHVCGVFGVAIAFLARFSFTASQLKNINKHQNIHYNIFNTYTNRNKTFYKLKKIQNESDILHKA